MDGVDWHSLEHSSADTIPVEGPDSRASMSPTLPAEHVVQSGPEPIEAWIQTILSEPSYSAPVISAVDFPVDSTRARVAERQAEKLKCHAALDRESRSGQHTEEDDDSLLAAAEARMVADEAKFMDDAVKMRTEIRELKRKKVPDRLKEVLKAQRAALAQQEAMPDDGPDPVEEAEVRIAGPWHLSASHIDVRVRACACACVCSLKSPKPYKSTR